MGYNIIKKVIQERVRAIIIHRGQILLIKRVKPDETYWVFPGGGLEQGENKERALVRECKEELGLDIEIKGLFLKRSFNTPSIKGQTEYFFTAKVIGGELGTGKGPEYEKDTKYLGHYHLIWINIADLPNTNLKPKEVKDLVYRQFSNQ